MKRCWLKSAKGKDMWCRVQGSSKRISSSLLQGTNSPGNNVWQHTQTIANQESSHRLWCPETLLRLSRLHKVECSHGWPQSPAPGDWADAVGPKVSTIGHTVRLSGGAPRSPDEQRHFHQEPRANTRLTLSKVKFLTYGREGKLNLISWWKWLAKSKTCLVWTPPIDHRDWPDLSYPWSKLPLLTSIGAGVGDCALVQPAHALSPS